MLVWAAVCLTLDQASKAAVLTRVGPGGRRDFTLVAIRPLFNGRAAIGGWPQRRTMVIAWAILAAALAAVLEFGPWFVRGAAPVAIGVALGGALGNVVDVWRHGAVVDFVDLGWWPVFNVADAAIVGGALVAIWYV